MPQSFHYLIHTTDCLGHHPKVEMVVIAENEQEAREEVAEYFHMHDEIESWTIADTLEVSQLAPDDPFAQEYADKGAHSYISR